MSNIIKIGFLKGFSRFIIDFKNNPEAALKTIDPTFSYYSDEWLINEKNRLSSVFGDKDPIIKVYNDMLGI